MSRSRLRRSQVARVSRRPKALEIQEEPPQSDLGQALHEDA